MYVYNYTFNLLTFPETKQIIGLEKRKQKTFPLFLSANTEIHMQSLLQLRSETKGVYILDGIISSRKKKEESFSF